MTRLMTLLATLAAFLFADTAAAQQLSKPFRKTSVYFSATEARQRWDEWETPPPDAEDSDSETNNQFGMWTSELEFNNPDTAQYPATIWTRAAQFSGIDAATGTFYCYSQALASIYIQGDAESDALSQFRFDFKLNNSGRLVLEGVIGVADFFGRDVSRDTPGSARALVRVVDRGTGTTVYRKTVSMNGDVPGGIDEFEFEGEGINLSAGDYRLIIRATADDVAIYDQVNFSLANAFIELEGYVEED